MSLKGGEQIRVAFVIETSGANCQDVVDTLESKGCGKCESSSIDPGVLLSSYLQHVHQFADLSKVSNFGQQKLAVFS